MSRGARFGGSSSFGGSSGIRFLGNRRRAAAGRHFSTTDSDENDKDSRCKYLKDTLQMKLANAEALDSFCFGCDWVKEKMSDCPGVEKLKFEREGTLPLSEIRKLPKQERTCRLLADLLKREARDAADEGIRHCHRCDNLNRIMVNWKCAELKLGAKKEGA